MKGYSVTTRAARKMFRLSKKNGNTKSFRAFVRLEWSHQFPGLSPKLQEIVNGGGRG
jgi:hypothetical protein